MQYGKMIILNGRLCLRFAVFDWSGDELPSSSYRLGVRAAPLHELLPSHLTHALKEALVAFEGQVSNFLLL